MDENIISTLSELIAKNILKKSGRSIKPDEALITSGLIDSFSLVDLALLVEDNFGVRIDDSELNSSTFDSLSQLANIIESRRT
jgi:acyl carrier protein